MEEAAAITELDAAIIGRAACLGIAPALVT
jgi:hypothetical protein